MTLVPKKSEESFHVKDYFIYLGVFVGILIACLVYTYVKRRRDRRGNRSGFFNQNNIEGDHSALIQETGNI